MNRKAISGINFAQRDTVKANEVLNLYSRQSPNRPVEAQTNPMEVEEQKQEAKDEQKVEQIQQGVQSGAGSIVKQAVGNIMMGADPMSEVMKAGMRELGLQ
jgi:hypothetical protein